MIRHATEKPRPLREFNPSVPDGLQQIINWMMAKEPDQRYPTPERAAQALRVFLSAGAAEPPPTDPDQNMKNYLDWLEVENSKDDLERPAGLAANAPTQTAPPLVKTEPGPHPPAPPAKSEASGRHSRPVAAAREEKGRDRKHRRKDAGERDPKGERHPDGKPVAAAVAAEFDVEVVPAAPPPVTKPERPRPFQLTPRDFIMFGIGVGGTLFAIIFAMLLAKVLTGRPSPTSSPETPPEQTAPPDQP